MTSISAHPCVGHESQRGTTISCPQGSIQTDRLTLTMCDHGKSAVAMHAVCIQRQERRAVVLGKKVCVLSECVPRPLWGEHHMVTTTPRACRGDEKNE